MLAQQVNRELAGQRIDALTIHKICFVLWLVATGAHVLGRAIPAVQLAAGRRVPRLPGKTARAVVVIATLAVGLATGAVVMNLPTDWTNGGVHHTEDR